MDSGVPQGTVLGPCLFNVFIDDLDECIVASTNIIKFADDTKTWRSIENDRDRDALQQTLNNLQDWADQWGMQFNTGKCKVMHIGNRNPCHKNEMGGVTLAETAEEKDVGGLHQPHLETKQSL